MKRRVDKTLSKSKKDLEFEAIGNREYEIEAIIDCTVYGQQANDSNQIPDLYYLVS